MEITELYDSKAIAKILNEGFLAFAEEYNFTKENAPNHLAFIDSDGVQAWLDNGLKMFGYKIDGEAIACAGYSHKNEKIFLIERLAVLPEYQNRGIGRKLMVFIESLIKDMGGSIAEIHVTDSNKKLKDWYNKQCYEEIYVEEVHIPGIKKVPFKACVMRKHL